MPDATSGPEPAPADEFDRELRELTEGTAGKPMFIEPSAAERAKQGVALVAPAGRRGRRHGWLAAIAILVVLLLVAAALAWVDYARSAGTTGGARSAGTGPAPADTPELMGTIAPFHLFVGPPADPFAGTPADHWANGAAGIVAPAARPAGAFTAKQVAAAYATARKLLIAANLDKQTLLGGPPTALAKLLTPRQRAQFLDGLNKTGVSKGGYPLSTRKWVASFAPGSAELIGTVIKVHGTMTARATTGSGTVVLVIDVNYLFAYAVQSPGDPADWTRVVDHEYGSIDFAHWDDPDAQGGALEPWDRAIIGNAGIQCGTDDGYIHPDYPSDRSVEVRPPGPAISPYSSATGIPGGGAVCGRTTGT
jgi:hypothetical protein